MTYLGKTAIKHVHVVDVVHDSVKKNQTILIKDGLIEDIVSSETFLEDDSYTVIDGVFKTAIPGLIDAHLHLLQSGVDDFLKPYTESFSKKLNRHLMVNLQSGVTTLRNMPGGQNLKVHKVRDDINQGKRVGPRIVSSGPALSAPHGYFSTKMFFPFPAFFRFLFKRFYKVTSLSIDVNSKEEAVKAVRKLKAYGVDFIKTTTTGTFIPYIDDEKLVNSLKENGLKEATIYASMKKEVLETIVKEAHNFDLKVAAHTVFSVEDFKRGVQLGIDSLEHTPFGKIDEDTFDLMNQQNTYWVPTAFAPSNYLNMIKDDTYYDTMMKDLPKRFFKLGKQSILKIKERLNNNDLLQTKMMEDIEQLVNVYIPYNIKKAMEKNIKIVAAVDAGASGAGYVPHGKLSFELKLYTGLGMSPMDALKTATINPASLLGLDDEIGSLEKGKKADIVLCDKNPVKDIMHLNTVDIVICAGHIIKTDKTQ